MGIINDAKIGRSRNLPNLFSPSRSAINFTKCFFILIIFYRVDPKKILTHKKQNGFVSFLMFKRNGCCMIKMLKVPSVENLNGKCYVFVYDM